MFFCHSLLGFHGCVSAFPKGGTALHIGVLNDFPWGIPNLHMAVVSADMGVGENSVPGRTAVGDNEILQGVTLKNPGCALPTDL